MTHDESDLSIVVKHGVTVCLQVEHALPHQYIHAHQDGQFVTTPVSHSGGVSECRDYAPKTNSYTESKPGCLTSNNAQKTDSDLGNKAKCLTVNNAPKTDANMEIKPRCLTVNNAQKTNSDTGNKSKTDCLTVNEAQKTDTGMGSKTNCVTTDMSLYYMAALLCIIFAMVVAFMLSS
ncbi:hypothetical protein Hanom_Chr04g00378681 [Helianthus anomalus]